MFRDSYRSFGKLKMIVVGALGVYCTLLMLVYLSKTIRKQLVFVNYREYQSCVCNMYHPVCVQFFDRGGCGILKRMATPKDLAKGLTHIHYIRQEMLYFHATK